MTMKQYSIVTTCLVALALTVSAFSQNPPAKRRGGRPPGSGKLKRMDTNQDGAISRDEWKGKPRGFERVDRNNDGSISRDEALMAAQTHGKQRLKQMDVNHDQRISRDEWAGDAELFNRLDADNDGVLTLEELKARRRNSKPN